MNLRLSLVILLLVQLSVTSLFAQTITIGAVSVSTTQDNDDVLGDGTVSFSAKSQTLVLKECLLSDGIAISRTTGLTLVVKGSSRVETSTPSLLLKDGSEVTLRGDRITLISSKGSAISVDANCKLTIESVSLEAKGAQAGITGSLGFLGETVVVNNADATIEGNKFYAIGDLQTFTVTKSTLEEPQGGAWNPANLRFCDVNGKIASRVVFKADEKEPQVVAKIAFGGKDVDLTTSSNDLFGDGQVAYDATKKQFTLENYRSKEPMYIEAAKGYHFILKGNSYVEAHNKAIVLEKGSDVEFTGDGELSIVSKDAEAIHIGSLSRLTFMDIRVSIKGKRGISGGGYKAGATLVVDSARVAIMAEEYALGDISSFSLLHAKIVQPSEAYWSHETHQIVDIEKMPVKHLIVESRSDNEGKDLGMLAIGDVYLDLNKSRKDVLGDGKVSYDAETHTLTLNNACIETEQNALYMQGVQNLIIDIIGDCVIESKKKSAVMLFLDTNLTLTGPGKLTLRSPENAAIYLLYSNQLTIRNTDVIAIGRWGISGINGLSGESVTLNNCHLQVKATEDAICAVESLSLEGVSVVAPKGAKWDVKQRCFIYEGKRVKDLVIGKEELTPYTTDQPAIRLTTVKSSGKWQFTFGIAKNDKETAWIDLNGNGVYDKGEEDFKSYRLWKPAIQSQTITIYGKFNWVSCSLNDLTELDVSQNDLITFLDCSDNQISELNLANNSAINKLYCNNNKLRELDLSALIGLKELYCFDNLDLQNLDLTKQTKLEELYTNRCALTELKLASHPLLTQLKADENKLTTINLSQLPALQKLWLASNQLTQIDLSSLDKLDEVQLQFNKLSSVTLPSTSALAIFACRGNPLKTLDLSSQHRLTLLDCSETQLSLLDLTSCPVINGLYCYSSRLTQEVLDKMLEQLPARTEEEDAFCVIVDTTNPNEKNEASTSKVKQALEKGWKVYDFRGGENNGCNPYQGSTAVDLVSKNTPRILVQGRQVELLGSCEELAIFRVNGELVSTVLPLVLSAGEYIVSMVVQGVQQSQKILIK